MNPSATFNGPLVRECGGLSAASWKSRKSSGASEGSPVCLDMFVGFVEGCSAPEASSHAWLRVQMPGSEASALFP